MESRKKPRLAVSIVLFDASWEGPLFFMRRADSLTAFPGFTSFPGGSVESSDYNEEESSIFQERSYPKAIINALVREIREELGFEINWDDVLDFKQLGEATSPEFNPHRFETIFFGLVLKKRPSSLKINSEIKSFDWIKARDLYASWDRGEEMMVPPMIRLLKLINEKTHDLKEKRDPHWALMEEYDKDRYVPRIEIVSGLEMFLPLSRTFPPANRTNCFLFGDKEKYLVDPSPKDEKERDKLIGSVDRDLEGALSGIFITHHHPDHYQFLDEISDHYSVPIYVHPLTKRFLKVSSSTAGRFTEIGEGETLGRWKELEVKIVWTPGHAPGHLGLGAFSPSGEAIWFIAGDLYQTIGTVVVGGEYGDMDDYLNSLDKIISLRPRFLFPSHGMATGGVHRLVETKRHRLMREEQIKNGLFQGLTLDQIYEEIYPGLDSSLRPYALATIQAHLKRLEKL